MLACLSGSGIVYTHPSEKTTIAAPPGYLVSALGFQRVDSRQTDDTISRFVYVL